MSTLREQFGNRLRQLRHDQDLTQEQLAAAAEISVEFLSNIERGINAPSFETLEKLSHALQIPVRELFTFEDQAEVTATRPEKEQWIPLAEAARQSGYSVSLLQRLVREGTIEGWKPGRNWLTTLEAVMAYKRTTRRGRPRKSDENQH